ncbi:histidine kinase [Myroides albus]|uniref:histidine kinase n=1 Tax=Myroides albus TaxID=2562892 RepID=A0A6I3LI16_9FLAO|nr:tetratricopeptide repeat-containing sensor histidine kinase [Myroides albus]MTG96800.1 histidine kinase [Myroides albus]UVD78450.1 histidine kinase [Myroides albus]
MKLKRYFSSSNLLLYAILCIALCLSCSKKDNPNLEESNLLGRQYTAQADSLFDLGALEKAFELYLLSNQELREINDHEMITYNNLKIATIYLTIGDANSAQETIAKELYYIKEDDTSLQIYSNLVLSLSYTELLDFENAIEYAKKSLAISNDKEHQIITKNNIGYLLIENKQYKEAEEILSQVLQEYKDSINPTDLAKIYNNLGKAKYRINKASGRDELSYALKLREKENDKYELVSSYIALSEYYSDKDANNALNYAKMAYEHIEDISSKKEKLTILEILINNSAINHPIYKKSVTDYIALSNQFHVETQLSKNQFAKIRYDYDKHAKENSKLKYNLQVKNTTITKQHNTVLVLVCVLLLILLVVTIVYSKIKKKHIVEKGKQVYKTESRIAKKVHDELANDIFNTLIYTQNFNLQDPEKKEHLIKDLDAIYKKSRNIATQLNSIDTEVNFTQTLTNLFNEYTSEKTKIIITGIDNIDFSMLVKIQKITIYRILQELLVNMTKHSMATLVVFKFTKEANGISIYYKDNGIGLIYEDIKKKNGISNMESRIENIKGYIIFDRENEIGTKLSIYIPYRYV